MPRANTLNDFWIRVEKIPDGCWTWKHRLSPLGYGIFDCHEKRYRAHRYAWESCRGDIPAKMDVLHRCDNRKCVNPEHLFLGTQTENNEDRNQKGRQAKGEMVNTCKLTMSDVMEIREKYKSRHYTLQDLANEYSVSRSNISSIVRCHTWKHI